MLAPRWRKVLADLWSNKVRTLLAVLSIAAGVQVVGTITTSYVIISRDMDVSFTAINPAGGTLSTSDFDAAFVDVLQRQSGVGQLEPRARLNGFNLHVADLPVKALEVTGIADFERIRLDQLVLDEGHWPRTLELVLERTALDDVPVTIGDIVRVETPDGRHHELQLVGFVVDRTTNATNANLPGYVTLNTLDSLGQPSSFNWLGFTALKNGEDKGHVDDVGQALTEQFRRNGGVVNNTLIRDPGRHPAAQQAEAILALLAVIGVLTVFLSAFLVTNTISALMAQQIRHIGVMKAVGARTGQIMGMYLVLLLCLGLPALLLAAPLGLWAGTVATRVIAGFLNFTIAGSRLELLPLAVMFVLSLGVPLLAGLLPVRKGAATTISQALGGYGLNTGFRQSKLAGFLSRLDKDHSLLERVPRPLLISLRNIGRRKARLLLTLATLIMAGAIFMGVLSAQASMNAGLDRMYQYYQADVNVNFERDYPVAEMVEKMAEVPGVKQVEGWIFAAGEVLGEAAPGRLTIAGPPPDSTIVARAVEEGRWLKPEDRNAIVICTRLMQAHPNWQIGSTVRLALNNSTEAEFVIIGTFPFPSGEGNNMAVTNYATLEGLLAQQGRSSTFRLITEPSDTGTQDRVRDALVAKFKEEGYGAEVTTLHATADALNTILSAIVLFLLLMALLVAVVGALGLAGTMSINVLERTREIGVMRAVGASNRAIMELVVGEGLLTGLLSWIAAALLGLPVGMLLARILGQGLFDAPFAFVLAWQSLLIWLVIVFLLSTLASALPARNASRLTVREALAYE